MTTTYELIASTTLSASAASYTFSSIPATYTDLLLKISARSDQAAYTELVTLRFNGISTTTYSYRTIDGTNGTIESVAASSETYSRVGPSAGSVNTANSFSNLEVYIPSYRLSQNKPISGIGVSETNSAGAGEAWVYSNASLWRASAAITSIQILPIGGPNWVTGSSFYLYGIKNT